MQRIVLLMAVLPNTNEAANALLGALMLLLSVTTLFLLARRRGMR